VRKTEPFSDTHTPTHAHTHTHTHTHTLKKKQTYASIHTLNSTTQPGNSRAAYFSGTKGKREFERESTADERVGVGYSEMPFLQIQNPTTNKCIKN
jgi:hypothetical protein